MLLSRLQQKFNFDMKNVLGCMKKKQQHSFHTAQWAKLGGQKELCENSKIKDLELIFSWIPIMKHEKDMLLQIKWC